MAKSGKEQKSARLKELEDVFERRTRRFSPFEVLGLKSTGDLEREKASSQDPPRQALVEADYQEKPDPLTSGSNRPRGGSIGPSPGVGRPTRVVVVNYNTTTTAFPPMAGSDPPTSGSERPTPGSVRTSSVQSLESEVPSSHVTTDSAAIQTDLSARIPEPSLPRALASVADVVAATQAGTQIGPKARKVLAYLNSIRSLEYEAYTVPVGYGQISARVGVDSDYLRRKALPKLAMLGFIAVAKKSLEGTVYHLQHDRDFIAAVTGESLPPLVPVAAAIGSAAEPASDSSFSWPEWIDKEQWGWLSQESIQRLVQKAGSEAQAGEKLEIIIYNETHGAPHQRVRNRRSVLAHYLSAPQAEIWPNDEGFETLTMKQSRLEKEQAQKEKTLAQETLKAKREAQKVRFSASLSDSQWQWIRQEAKRVVDMRPEAKLLTSRFPLYKAEEDRLLEEWMERAEYGEVVPTL